ncbi:MAG: serine/threonine protein kinase [Candidatus Sumerlaeaceae bacterium]|nr:serine/threonine protein kinase [Candidatus Sumerlaeaceae bacterium]
MGPYSDRVLALREMLAGLGLVSEACFDRCADEARAAGWGTVWTRLRDAGYLDAAQTNTMELAAKGYLAIGVTRSILTEHGLPSEAAARAAPPNDDTETQAVPVNLAAAGQPVPPVNPTPTGAPLTPSSPWAQSPPKSGGSSGTSGKDETGGRTMAAALLGRRLGKYQIASQIGKGAVGAVFLAHHTVLNIPVAIKVLDPRMALNHPEVLQRFMHEAQMASRITHPNVIRVLDCDEIDGFYLFVMEYIDGITVGELISLNGTIAEGRALSIAQSVAEGLEAALEIGIIHRDIKPANILLTKTRQVKLADLGLAKRLDEDATNVSDTKPHTSLGTPLYFSPEQAMDASTVDHRTDIYSLGATLYHMLTGQTPFHGKNVREIVKKHHMDPVKPPMELVPAISKNTSDLVVQMLGKQPGDRPANYADLIKAIQACVVRCQRTAAAQRTPTAGKSMFSWLFLGKSR